jgi:arylsulfatase A-like enzyme
MNVLVIVIDALRSDIFGHTGLIPNITGMVESGVFLENACSCTNATDSSVTSLLSGRHPLSHGIVEQGPQISTPEAVRRLNRNGVLLLSQMLGSRGFATHAVDWLGRWHKRGYDHYSGTGEVFAAEREDALAVRLGRKLPGPMPSLVPGRDSRSLKMPITYPRMLGGSWMR